MKYPTITAVMVTLGRIDLVQESYHCFQSQTYPAKRLLIVTDGGEVEHEALKNIAYQDKQVAVLHISGTKKTLGELRNISIEYATELSIQWDDDDWYGPTRMMDQWKGLSEGKAGVMLTEQLHYFRDTGEVAWTVDTTGIEGTLLLDRKYKIKYPMHRRGEDTVVKRELQRRGLLSLVKGGTCYCRTYHGGNTWDRAHHVERIKIMGKTEKQMNKQQLEKAAVMYNWKKDWKVIYG